MEGVTMGDQDNKVLTAILERLVRVETKIDAMTDVKNTAAQAKETANKALMSTESAHLRLNKIDKIIFWAATSIIITFIGGLAALLYSKG